MSELALGFGSFAEDIAMYETPRLMREQQQQPELSRLSFLLRTSGREAGAAKCRLAGRTMLDGSVGATCPV
jgi:hypothetical protein